MDGFDPLTAGVPSRSLVDAAEEAEAEAALAASPPEPVILTARARLCIRRSRARARVCTGSMCRGRVRASATLQR